MLTVAFFFNDFPTDLVGDQTFRGFYRLYTVRDLGITQFPSFLFSLFFFSFFLLFFSLFFSFFFTNKGKRLQGLQKRKKKNYKRLCDLIQISIKWKIKIKLKMTCLRSLFNHSPCIIHHSPQIKARNLGKEQTMCWTIRLLRSM